MFIVNKLNCKQTLNKTQCTLCKISICLKIYTVKFINLKFVSIISTYMSLLLPDKIQTSHLTFNNSLIYQDCYALSYDTSS